MRTPLPGEDGPLEIRVSQEIEREAYSCLPEAWDEFKEFLAPAAVREFLCLPQKDKLEVAAGTDDLLVTLVVDAKHFMVTAVELTHVKGIDFASYHGSEKKGSEVQLNVWFLDDSRFYWESGPEEMEQMRRFALYIRRYLGRRLEVIDRSPGDAVT
ncbi:MAG: hypothetical protein V3U79_02580 [Dehalococcoidia bacterium]